MLAMKIRITLITAISFYLSIARADEAIFAWTYTTDLLPKGRWEFEQWMTARWEKEHGTYDVFDFREELEFGVTDNFRSRFTSTIITSMRTTTCRWEILPTRRNGCQVFTRRVAKTCTPGTIHLRRS